MSAPTNDPQATQATDGFEERHGQFVAALDRLNPSAESEMWESMAATLGWSVDEVQRHAYLYFVALCEHDGRPKSDEVEKQDEWSFEESLMLDNLLARYRKEFKDEGNPEAWSVDHLQEYFPDRTLDDIRARIKQIASSNV